MEKEKYGNCTECCKTKCWIKSAIWAIAIVVIVFLNSCASHLTTAPRLLNGTNEVDFVDRFSKKKARARVESRVGDNAIYSLPYSANGKNNWHRVYYYFENGLLIETQQENRDTDHRQRIDVNVNKN